jgi:hypothetical protein
VPTSGSSRRAFTLCRTLACTSLLLFLLVRSAPAEQSSPKIFIHDIRIFTIGRTNIEINPGWIMVVKNALQRFNYQVDDCKESQEPLLDEQRRMTDEQLANQERLVFRSRCRTPPDVIVLDCHLVLAVDPELDNRRAILRFISPFDPQPTRSGGYAQKPGEPKLSWDDIIDRGIERTMNGYNDPTSIQMVVPAETHVGQTLHLDARNSWDEDGDTFELRWRVTTTGCIGADEMLPADHRPCAIGMNGPIEVYTQSGPKANTREFRVPIVGDYDVAVRAKLGDREEPEHVFHVRAYPQRSNSVFSRVGVFQLPSDFFEQDKRATPGLMIGVGYVRRVIHRIGLLGSFEEVHLGASFGSMHAINEYSLPGGPGSIQAGLEAIVREMDRAGRFGLTSVISLNGFTSTGTRGNYPRDEYGLFVESLTGIYIGYADNHIDTRSSWCARFCPSLTIGPTLTMMFNHSTSKLGIVGGGEILMGVDF